jgi:hypothetical protein
MHTQIGSNQPDMSPLGSASKRPSIIMGPQNTTIYEGQSVVLLCITSETSSSSSTQINWLQNDLIIEPTLMRRFEINQLLGNLRIVSIQKSDAGTYKCIASNEFGMSTAEAFVQVKSNGPSSNKMADSEPAPSAKKSPLHHFVKPEDLTSRLPQVSRPAIQQIGQDKILLKWNVVDASGANLDLTKDQKLNTVVYFKVDYKTNKPVRI